MRFRRFSVGSFETLRNVQGVFAPRLSVIWSEDEAGKAAFVRFIRQTLSPENLFDNAGGLPEGPAEEKRASDVFGSLILDMDDSRALRVELGSAEPGKTEPGRLSLLTEDAESAEKSPDAVTEEMKYLCLAAAAGLDTLPFSNFAARLEEKEKASDAPGETLFSELSKRIQANEAEIEDLRAVKRNYKSSMEELEEKGNAVVWTTNQLKDERRRLRRLELVSQARPLWLEARELEKALAALGPRRAKPRDGTARLDALVEKAAVLQKEVDARKLKSDYEALRRKHIESNPSLNLLPYRGALENLEEETNQLKQARIEMLPLIEEAGSSEKRLAALLADFSPHWTEKDLLEAPLTLSSEDRANTVREALRAAERHAEEITRTIETEQASIATLEVEVASIRSESERIRLQRFEMKKQKTEDADPAAFLEERRERLLEIRHGLLRNDILFWEIRAEKMRADTLEEENKAEDEPLKPNGSYIANFLLALFLFLSGTAAALEYLTAILYPYGLITALFFGLVALLPLSQIILARKGYNRQKRRREAQHQRRNKTIEAINARIDEKRRRMQAIVASIEQKSKDLGIHMPSTVDDLDGEFNRLMNEILQSRSLENCKDGEWDVLQKIDKSARRKNQLSENLKRVGQEKAEILGNWRAWLTQNHFDANLTPDGFLTFLGQMREARKELQFLETLRDRLARRNEYVSTLETKIRVLSGRVGLELSKENLPIIFRSLEEGLELAKQIAVSMEAQNTVDIERAVWEKALAAVQNDIRALCEEARVSSAAAFRSFVEECDRREVVEARLNEVRSILTGFLGAAGEGVVSAAGEADGNENEHKAPKPRKWAPYEADLLGDALKQAEEMEELRITVADRANTLEKLRAAYDILERRTRSPFSDERLAELERENADLRAQVQIQSKGLLTVVLSRQFAEKAAERGVRERRKILRRARQLFSEQFFPFFESLSSSGDELDNRANGAPPYGQEQISFCLNLAAAYRRAERATSIPIVLDDVLAQFDENRRHELIQALWQTSGRIQIVLLTDQPFTARLIQKDLEQEDGFALLKM
jgi:uncharacterized protein YhaN